MLDRSGFLNAFDNLPIEILCEIFSYLETEDISQAGKVNKTLNIAAFDNLFWKKKFAQHFPHLVSKLNSQDEINWHAEFSKAYDLEYQHLPSHVKKWFFLVKEGDIKSLKDSKPAIKLSDLCQCDKNRISLLALAQKQKNQTLLNYFYQLALEEYSVGVIVNTRKTDVVGKSILHWAILCHQSEAIIEQLILLGANVNAHALGESPLYIAAKNGYLGIVKTLLEHGVSINDAENFFNHETALHAATQKGHLAVANMLLTCGANIDATTYDGKTPLHLAAQNGHTDVVNTLLEHGANINAVANYCRSTPLHLAAKNGHRKVIDTLLTHGANIDATTYDGKTLLHFAAQDGHIDLINTLLIQGVDVDDTTGNDQTPLHLAIENGHHDVVNTLLAHGANVNAADRLGVTPLYLATQRNDYDWVSTLLAHGANVNAAAVLGVTPLFIAARYGFLDIANILLAHRANIDARTCDDYTPLSIASKSNHPDIVKEFCKQKLLAYISKTKDRKDNHYKTSFHLFCIPFNFGYSAEQKKAAAAALKSVIFDGADEGCLDQHKGALNNGELKTIYRLLKR